MHALEVRFGSVQAANEGGRRKTDDRAENDAEQKRGQRRGMVRQKQLGGHFKRRAWPQEQSADVGRRAGGKRGGSIYFPRGYV